MKAFVSAYILMENNILSQNNLRGKTGFRREKMGKQRIATFFGNGESHATVVPALGQIALEISLR